jgi:hypothetical protein
VEVVEHDHERFPPGENFQKRTDGPVRAVSLIRHRRVLFSALLSDRGKDSSELMEQAVVEVLTEAWILRGNVGIKRFDPHAEGHVALELRGRPDEHDVAAGLRPLAELLQETRLADSGLSFESDAGRRAGGHGFEPRIELFQLTRAPDGLPGARRHRASSLMLLMAVSGSGLRQPPDDPRRASEQASRMSDNSNEESR